MVSVSMHLDDKKLAIRRVTKLEDPTITIYDGRGGYLTLFLDERSIDMLMEALKGCKQRQDITEQEVRNVAPQR